MGVCRKELFKNRKEAKKRLKYLKKKKGTRVKDAYDCPDCEGWHLTSKNKKASRCYTRHLKNKDNV